MLVLIRKLIKDIPAGKLKEITHRPHPDIPIKQILEKTPASHLRLVQTLPTSCE